MSGSGFLGDASVSNSLSRAFGINDFSGRAEFQPFCHAPGQCKYVDQRQFAKGSDVFQISAVHGAFVVCAFVANDAYAIGPHLQVFGDVAILGQLLDAPGQVVFFCAVGDCLCRQINSLAIKCCSRLVHALHGIVSLGLNEGGSDSFWSVFRGEKCWSTRPYFVYVPAVSPDVFRSTHRVFKWDFAQTVIADTRSDGPAAMDTETADEAGRFLVALDAEHLNFDRRFFVSATRMAAVREECTHG